ncbi:guanine deaminase [Intrasporangium calvum]|uniref:Guanine deaminase n=1 Tax=Intrasporangium calvum TaxID=53358 RepID=A0ABT5GH06_9MICO|nr:guanine deaminase [Intrasporangium calvum]MDC5697543.1 guanine deaminase [Intrasporangium calvum]
MTIFRGTVLDTPGDERVGAVRLRADPDAALLVEGGRVTARGAFADVMAAAGSAERHDVVDLTDGLILPGLVDTHVHYPQVRIIGGLGLPLLQWLEERALPEEARLQSVTYARGVAAEFVHGLTSAGTTTALVFGSHFAPAMDVLFEAAATAGLRVTAGLVASDRGLPKPLLTTPDRFYDESMALASRWHLHGRTRFAVTPRFSYSASVAMLDACASVLKDVDGALFTSHVNENVSEVAAVAELFRGAEHYVATYDRHGLVGPRTVLAHNVHATAPELALLAARGASVAHCPSSNAALGSGLFPLARHVEQGVRVALGSDVGAGTGFFILKEGLHAYLTQRSLGSGGLPLAAADLLHLATRSGALALGLGEEVGDLSVGKQFDAIWVRPRPGEPLAVGLRHASSPEDALARTIALATPSDLAGVWIAGEQVPAVHPG